MFFSKYKYELGEQVGNEGIQSSVYRIIGKKKLVAKVCRGPISRNQVYLHDIEFGNFLREKGFLTPKYIGVCEVLLKGEPIFALIMEVVEDGVLIRLPAEYTRLNPKYDSTVSYSDEEKFAQNILIREFKKINEELKEIVLETTDFQGLYSKKEKKLYLIDFAPHYLNGESLFRSLNKK